jgi:hypothetical protein
VKNLGTSASGVFASKIARPVKVKKMPNPVPAPAAGLVASQYKIKACVTIG